MINDDFLEKTRETIIRNAIIENSIVSQKKIDDIYSNINSEVYGIGILQPLVEMENVTDIIVNAPNSIWIDTGNGMEKVDGISFKNEQALHDMAVRICSLGEKRIDDASPIADALLPDGTRANVVLPPISNKYPLISLRVPKKDSLTLKDLFENAMISDNDLKILHELIKQKKSIIISGGTGTGKTTLLSAIVAQMSANERIICIEQVREINQNIHPHIVFLTQRYANIEGSGAVSLEELVRCSLRMRPDKIVLGEVRGSEIKELLLCMNTGHKGSISTLHANNIKDIPSRIEALASTMDRVSLAKQAASAIDCVLHLSKVNSKRKLVEIGALELDKFGEMKICPL